MMRLRIVRTRTLADIEVVDGHTDCIRHRCGLGHRINCLTVRVEHKVARILIRTLLRIGKVMERTFLRGRILPALTHTIPRGLFLCRQSS